MAYEFPVRFTRDPSDALLIKTEEMGLEVCINLTNTLYRYVLESQYSDCGMRIIGYRVVEYHRQSGLLRSGRRIKGDKRTGLYLRSLLHL